MLIMIMMKINIFRKKAQELQDLFIQFYSVKDPLILGNHKNITHITVILSYLELENLTKKFEAR